MTSPELLLVGRVRKAHGIRGELVVELITDAPAAVFAAGRRLFVGTAAGVPAPGGGEVHVVRSSPFKGGLIVALREIADRTEAERWRDRTFLLPADELEPPGEDEVYLHDLVGMQVELTDGTPVGTVGTVWELPHGLILDVTRATGSVMIPYREEMVTAVDLKRRVVVVDPPEGLLE